MARETEEEEGRKERPTKMRSVGREGKRRAEGKLQNPLKCIRDCPAYLARKIYN